MIESIKQGAAALGVRLAVVPICALEDLKADVAALARDNELDELQRRIVEKRYVLNAPDGRAKSVVVTIWRRQLVKAIFHHKGKEVSCLVDDNYIDFADKHRALEELFAGAGFSLDYVNWLPQKLLAVRSGLCEYGRNNLAYSGIWGSFVAIGTYVSDIWAEDYVWREAKVMAHCAVCAKCTANCPAKAILPDRFLIDAQACLADINPRDDRDIPDWVPKSAHHALFGCYRCQEVCRQTGFGAFLAA